MFDLDQDIMQQFMLSLTAAELAKFDALTGDDVDEDTPLDTLLPVLGVMAAHRLGHPDVTTEDAAQLSAAETLQLMERAATIAPERNQRITDLLAELQGK